MKWVEVWAGPDDYTFERDRHLWKLWIKQNLPNCGPFVVKAHPERADIALIIFEAEKWNDIFILKKPEYIEPSMVEIGEPWILGE